MAAEQLAKFEFTAILHKIGRKYELIDLRWMSEKLFEVKFRTQIDRESEDFNALCDEWVDLFSEVTNTVWAKKISNTGPKIRFRKQYQCWTQGGKTIQKDLLFDARRCKGTLDMKVLTDNPLTRRKNRHIRLGLNVVVKVNFIHLHLVDRTKSNAFFVHDCPPLTELPKTQIQPNDRLPQLVAQMVQKGLRASPKVVNPNPPAKIDKSDTSSYNNNNQHLTSAISKNVVMTDAVSLNSKEMASSFLQENMLLDVLEKSIPQDEAHLIYQESDHHLIQDALQIQQPTTIELLQNVPGVIQSLETIKLEFSPHLQQYTQVVVSDLPESLLMCPSLMFDASQVISMSGTLPSHFTQVHSQDPNVH